MTDDKLAKLNKLQAEIKNTEGSLIALKGMSTHSDHWISISWGNGSARAALLTAPDTLQTLVTIQESLEFKLDTLTKEYEES